MAPLSPNHTDSSAEEEDEEALLGSSSAEDFVHASGGNYSRRLAWAFALSVLACALIFVAAGLDGGHAAARLSESASMGVFAPPALSHSVADGQDVASVAHSRSATVVSVTPAEAAAQAPTVAPGPPAAVAATPPSAAIEADEHYEPGSVVFENLSAAFDAVDTNDDGYFTTESGVAMNEATLSAAMSKKMDEADDAPDTLTMANSLDAARQAAVQARAGNETEEYLNVTRKTAKYKKATVRELYTFGAPATTEWGVYDAQSANGCFAGLRSVTQGGHYVPATGIATRKSDPVPSLLDFAFSHALMPFSALNEHYVGFNNITGCDFFEKQHRRLRDSPKWDNLWWLDGHMIYPSVLVAHAQSSDDVPYSKVAPNDLHLLSVPKKDPPLRALPDGEPVPVPMRRLASDNRLGMFEVQDYHNLTPEQRIQRAAMFSRLTFLDYDRSEQIAMGAKELGWTMIARANAATDYGAAAGMMGVSTHHALDGTNARDILRTTNTFSDGFGDHLLLLQHPETLECAIIFEGSSLRDIKDWFSNLNFASSPYCGFGPSHQGFRAKLYRMVGGIDYRQTIHRQVAGCSAVTVAGHSLGGAQAELYAACINNPIEQGEDGFVDYRLMQIPKQHPRKLMSFHSDKMPGYFLRNKGNQYCMDVQGSLRTVYRSSVIFYHCELPNSTYSHDQMWNFTEEGYIVSKLSGKCIDGNVSDSASVRQYTCQRGVENSTQRWRYTPQGFLQNQANKKCINGRMQLYECPFTDQQWEMKPTGAVVNKLSGKCLDVYGDPGTKDGQHLVLWPCEDSSETDQRWTLTAEGFLQNKLSGKCVVKNVEQQNAQQTYANVLVLGSCEDGLTRMRFKELPEAFLQNLDSGRCLNVIGAPGTADGTRINLADCEVKGISTSGLWKFDERGFILNVGDSLGKYRCMEIYALPWHEEQKKADGAELWTDFCEVNTDQKWHLTKTGYLKNVIGGNKCLGFVDVPWLTPEQKDTTLWIDNCAEPADPALATPAKWTVTHSGRLVNKFSMKCMAWLPRNDTEGEPGLPEVGVEVQPFFCKQAGIHATWELQPGGEIVSKNNGKCLDVGGPDFAENPPAVLRKCSASDAQRWEHTPEGFLRNKKTGMCVNNMRDFYVPERMSLLLIACPNGARQQWDMMPSGQIRNRATGKCLDGPQPGMQFYMMTASVCKDNSTSQQWEKINAPQLILT